MWIKVFYWMRLFASLSYYVKLIMQTIADAMPFMTMMTIIIAAFGNYFFVIQNNLKFVGNPDDSYYDSFYDNSAYDVLVSMYLLGALGDFDSGAYG